MSMSCRTAAGQQLRVSNVDLLHNCGVAWTCMSARLIHSEESSREGLKRDNEAESLVDVVG